MAAPDGEITLTDSEVTLRPWRPNDAAAVFSACQDPLIARFIPIPQPYTEADAQAFVTICRRDRETEDERSFAIVDALTGDLLGSIARHGPFGIAPRTATGSSRRLAVGASRPARCA